MQAYIGTDSETIPTLPFVARSDSGILGKPGAVPPVFLTALAPPDTINRLI